MRRIKPNKKKGLIWFYFGKRSEALQTEGEAKNEVEDNESDLHSGQSLLEDELEVDKELGQSTIEESNRQKERKKFLLKALTLFGCASGLWSSLIFYGLLQVGLENKSGLGGRIFPGHKVRTRRSNP